MIGLLARLFHIDSIADHNEHRRRYGVLCGGFGIFLNVTLFAVKLLTGLLSGSIAITADAFNNLSDASSSLITLIGFRLAGKRPDPDHPFGHGRMEYISALIVAMLIVVMGGELLISSIKSIRAPQALEFSWLTVAALIFSILVKMYMFYYNRRLGRRFDSAALRATAADSLSDCVSTGVVLLCLVLYNYFGINLDAWCGVLVSLFILYTGVASARDIISRIMGQPPQADVVQHIETLVLSHEQVFGVHDLIVHDYGPGRMIVSLHAEVPADGDMLAIHDTIDNIEKDLADEIGCIAIIHMDPIVVHDPLVIATRDAVAELICSWQAGATIHDFRMVPGPTHSNLIFDVVLPYTVELKDGEVRAELTRLVQTIDPAYQAVVSIDRSFLG